MSKVRKLFKYVRGCSFLRVAKESPVWFLAPAVVLGGGMAAAVSGYQPLVFDASQYQTQTAQASELDSAVDAAKLEEESAAASGKSTKTKAEREQESATAAKAAAKSSAKKASSLAKATLADGDFTGYSRCTEEDVFDYYLCLTITVKGGKVVNVSNVRGSGTGDTGDAALDEYDTINDTYLNDAKGGVLPQLLSAGKAGKTPSDIDTVSGATYSSSSMLEAYLDALGKSAAASGNKESVAKTKKAKKASAAKKAAASSDKTSGSSGSSTGGSEQSSNSGSGTDAGEIADDGLDYGTGSWTAYSWCEDANSPGRFNPYYIGVTVETSGGKVTGISNIFGDDKGVVDSKYVYDANQNAVYLNRAINGLNKRKPGVKTQLEAIIASGKADGTVDTISGATYSSKSILEAYRAALAQAHASTLTDASGAGDNSTGADPTSNDNSGAEQSASDGADKTAVTSSVVNASGKSTITLSVGAAALLSASRKGR